MADSHSHQPRVCFNCCKRELFHPMKGFKQLHRKLKQFSLIDVNKEEVALEKMQPYDVVVFGAPQEQFSDFEYDAIRQYIDQGGSVFLALGEGHGGAYSPLNQLLSGYGIVLNEDCVVRTVLHTYLHPKEVCITNGVTNREINRAAGKFIVGAGSPNLNGTQTNLGGTMSSDSAQAAAAQATSSLAFVYPHGLTMNVQRPAVPILSSGFMAYPLNRPIAAVWESPQADANTKKRGKLLVMGSALSFEDQWLAKEENDKLTTVLFDLLLHKLKLNQIDADDPEVTDYNYIPDTGALAERLRVAVEESDELPRDFTQLFDTKPFRFDTDQIPEVISAYEQLNIKHEPLTLIHPEFQAPLPPKLPATFDPTHREPAPPALDLYDLDEHFASERVRLSQITNKCTEGDDVDFYIKEAAELMGVTKKLRSPRNQDPRALLDYIFRQVVNYKKLNHEGNNFGGNNQPQQQQQANNGEQAQADGANGGDSMVRVLRVVGRDDGSVDLAPFDNASWVLTLHVDYGRQTIVGQLALQTGTKFRAPQECAVRGAVNPNDNQSLQWTAEVQNFMGQPVTFNYEAQQNGPTLNGRVEGSDQSSAQFHYIIEGLQ